MEWDYFEFKNKLKRKEKFNENFIKNQISFKDT